MRNRAKFALRCLSLFLPMFVCLMSLSACTTAPQPVPNVRYQENLKTKCATQLPRLNGATGKDAAELLTIYLEIYGQCAARHNQLVDEINLRESINYGKN